MKVDAALKLRGHSRTIIGLGAIGFVVAVTLATGVTTFIAVYRIDSVDQEALNRGSLTAALIFLANIALTVSITVLIWLLPALGIRLVKPEIRREDDLQAAWESLQRAESDLAKRTDAGQLVLPALWDVTAKRIDYYHQIATKQARRSFFMAQLSMTAGFVLLAWLSNRALDAKSTTIGVVTGSLGAIAVGFAGYISRTFVKSQESAASHLRSFFEQPVEFSRFLAAERLIESLDGLDSEKRATIFSDIARTIAASSAHPGKSEDSVASPTNAQSQSET